MEFLLHNLWICHDCCALPGTLGGTAANKLKQQEISVKKKDFHITENTDLDCDWCATQTSEWLRRTSKILDKNNRRVGLLPFHWGFWKKLEMKELFSARFHSQETVFKKCEADFFSSKKRRQKKKLASASAKGQRASVTAQRPAFGLILCSHWPSFLSVWWTARNAGKSWTPWLLG